jgi:thioredoxin 1
MKRIIVTLSLISLLLTAGASLAGAGNQAAPRSTPELSKMIGLGKTTVVFFLNPNGGPCKAQNEILVKLQKDKKNAFNIAYVSAENSENQKAFYDYGVRSLPSLVLVDKAGNISRVFSPGIQTYEALVAALDGIK